MRTYRIGVFGRGRRSTDGGADTLLSELEAKLRGARQSGNIELVSIPWEAWSHRRRLLRYAWCRLVRAFGSELPLVDLRPVCRRFRLDGAWFMAPAFVHIDIPFVYTVWDLGHRTIPEFPEMRSGRDPWTMREAQYRRMVGQATRVIVGNETGAAEVREIYGIPEEKLLALPFPNPSFDGIVSQRPAWLAEAPFFLYPAQFWPHKNHVTLLRAFALMRSGAGPEPHLVFVGSDRDNRDYLAAYAEQSGVARRVRFAGFVPRAELKALYEAAAGLLFPSLLGPNNLPPQEAAVLGCPMALSDLPGHREQMRDGALLVPPLQPEAWAAAMSRLLHEPGLRNALVTRARAVVASYTTERYLAGVEQALTELVTRRMLWR